VRVQRVASPLPLHHVDQLRTRAIRRDADRVDLLTRAIGPELLSSLAEEFNAIGQDVVVLHSCLADVAFAARAAEISPEDMLVAVRILSRTVFTLGTREADRVEEIWHATVRRLMSAYYAD
jgi:hypothetical protein